MLILKIVSPEKILFDGEATSVKVPGIKGQFEILNNHAPIVSALIPGKVAYTTDAGTETFDVTGGFVKVQKNQVDLCVEA